MKWPLEQNQLTLCRQNTFKKEVIEEDFKYAEPLDAVSIPVKMLKIEDFPAPLLPSNPKHSPSSTVKETPFTAGLLQLQQSPRLQLQHWQYHRLSCPTVNIFPGNFLLLIKSSTFFSSSSTRGSLGC